MAELDESTDLLRILIASDNHLGVWEKDEVRKDDSFRTFEEILKIAGEQKADFVLLGGDLFHENSPSRTTLFRTIDILSRHCLNDNPVAVRILSDQSQNFTTGRANFLSHNHNVGLPVFTIHGNHDDPSGADNLSAVDLLSGANLVNYFGKLSMTGSNIGKIRIAPVLMMKGKTKLALYGLGNVRDERLGRLFQTPGCVEWVRPENSEEYALSDWLNIFVLHQNRVQRGASAKNCVRESDLATFLDLIVWGHEHDCITSVSSPFGDSGCDILQPGSSVATALSEGEAKRKHVFVLEMLGNSWRIIPIPLTTVRPFLHENVVLRSQHDLDPEDSEGLTAFLEGRVDDMIERAVRRADTPGVEPMLPLIRLRVDYTDFSTINVQRFGQKYVGRVANPHDMLLWHKAPARKAKGPADVVPDALLRPTELDERQIEELIAENLNEKLVLVNEVDLGHALHDFVEKDERNAITNYIARALVEAQDAVAAEPGAQGGTEDADMAVQVQRHAAQRREAALAGMANGVSTLDATTSGAARAGTGAGRGRDAADDDEFGVHAATPAPSVPSGRGGGGGAPRQATLGEALARGGVSQIPLSVRNGPSRNNSAATPSKMEGGPAPTQRSVAGAGARGRGGCTTTAAKRKAPVRASGARGARRTADNMDSENEDMDADAMEDGMDGDYDAVEDSDDDMVDLTADDGPTPASRPAAKRTRGERMRLPVQKSTASAARGGSSRRGAPAGGSLLADSDDEDAAPRAPASRFARRAPATNMQGAPVSQQRSRLWAAPR